MRQPLGVDAGRWAVGWGSWLAACLAVAAGGRAADEWPQFRGPSGQGIAAAGELPLSWSSTENIAWKQALPGEGWSSPVVSGDQIWCTTAHDEGRRLHALACDARSGRIVHDVEVFRVSEPPSKNKKNSYASPTPVIEGDWVWVHFGTSGTACLERATGRVRWRNTELVLDHKEGPGSSPILWGQLLIVNCDGTDVQYVAALDKDTGRLVWKTPRSGKLAENPDQRKAYSTPLVIESAVGRQLVSTGADWVYGYEPATGRELWRIGYQGYSNVPRPVFDGERIYIATGYNTPQLWAIRADGQGDVSQTHVAWRYRGQAPANPSPLLIDGRLLAISDRGVLTCLDAATGSELWKHRVGGNFSASPILADGKVYLASEEGVVSIVRPGPDYELLAAIDMGEPIMASPAASGRALYLRTDTHLYRIEAPRPAAAAGGR